MPAFGPISRTDLLGYLRRLGYDGPHAGGKHQYMLLGGKKLRIPNPHGSDISVPLLARLLRQASISREEWEQL